MQSPLRQFFFGTSLGDNKVLNIGWLLFRVHTGLSIAIHAGWPKMNTIAAPGWFVDQVAGLGFTFPSPGFWAAMASWGEFIGGLCIAFGFLTRFSALQLAFQFFVISFLWYDNPEPFTGMYFQHSLFWGFVLVSFAGGGRYALDKLIMNKRKINSGAASKIAVASLLLFMVSTAGAQSTASTDDFKPAKGKWKGTLTYLDYTSGKPYTMPANVTISKNKNDKHQLILAFEYPDEPKANGNDTVLISNNGSQIDEATVISKQKNSEGNLEIVTERPGVDGNDKRKATIKHVYIIGKKTFISRKEVRFDGEEKFIMRNEFAMTR